MDCLTYDYVHTVPYEFDPSNLTESNIREVIRWHYDIIKWCKNHTTAPYLVDTQYSPLGITVSFQSEQDCTNFSDRLRTYHEIFLHD